MTGLLLWLGILAVAGLSVTWALAAMLPHPAPRPSHLRIPW